MFLLKITYRAVIYISLNANPFEFKLQSSILSTSAEIQELNWDIKGILKSPLNGAQPWAEQLYVGVQG